MESIYLSNINNVYIEKNIYKDDPDSITLHLTEETYKKIKGVENKIELFEKIFNGGK